MLKPMLRKLMSGAMMTVEEAYGAMSVILEGNASTAQLSSMITILSFRGIVAEELLGLTRAMRDHAIPIPSLDQEKLVDTCGTGASGTKTFNVSTASALVASAAGVKVAKHGNRSVTSQTGSADVLEELGLQVNNSPEEIKEAITRNGMCFMFAPTYHQAMKHAAVARKEIGFRSIFNILGPLTNPACAKYQVIGVFDPSYGMKMAQTLRALGSKHVLIVHGDDGLDEFTLSTMTNVTELKKGQIKQYSISPEEVGIKRQSVTQLRAKSPQDSANIILDVLRGRRQDGARDIVAYNAGAALYVGQRAYNLKEGVALAKQMIDSGQAYTHYIQMAERKGEVHHA